MKFIGKMPLFIIISILIACFSIADILSEDRDFSASENRYLEKFPTLTAGTVISGDFSKNYETYITDQFLYRDAFITMKSLSETALLKTENNDIIYGSEGFLFPKFYKFDNKVLQANLASIDRFAAAMTAPVAVMIIPSKYHPLIDCVPAGVPFVDQNFYISEINNYLSANADIVNAKDILTVNSQRYIFYRNDHHWTNYGAWLAYCQFAPIAGFTPFEYESKQILTSNGFLGTNYYKCHRLTPKADTVEYYDIDIRSLTADDAVYDSLYNAEQFFERDKYSAFIQGHNGLTIIETEHSAEKAGSILIIKDSFANSLIPMLCEHYNTIYAVDPRFYNHQLGYSRFAEINFDQILIIYSFETLAAPSGINFISLDFED